MRGSGPLWARRSASCRAGRAPTAAAPQTKASVLHRTDVWGDLTHKYYCSSTSISDVVLSWVLALCHPALETLQVQSTRDGSPQATVGHGVTSYPYRSARCYIVIYISPVRHRASEEAQKHKHSTRSVFYTLPPRPPHPPLSASQQHTVSPSRPPCCSVRGRSGCRRW